ncbi:MAG: hypothetical protein J3R72DRAFT_476957 [Linnemannia gamsii]|nr:MAG: hypothetical protein J3R72DRAFT_476957 [Linnemannia gamsii]
MGSELKAFSHNPTDDSFWPLPAQAGPNTNYPNEWFLSYYTHVPYQWMNNPTLTEFCFSMIGRADIERPKGTVAMNAWLAKAVARPSCFFLSSGSLSQVPRCIQYSPGVVLDVVLASESENVLVDSSVGTPTMVPIAALNSALTIGGTDARADRPSGPSSEEKLVEDLRVSSALAEPIDDISTCTSSHGLSVLPPSSRSKVEMSSRPALSFKQVVKLASTMSNESGDRIQQKSLSAKMDQVLKSQERMEQLQKQVLEHQEEAKRLQKVSDAKQEEIKQLSLAHYEEIKRLQIQALGQLAVLQSRIQAVLTQTYELHEYPIPRLFIILPQFPSGWDIMQPFTDKYRLYFLCECGEHTKAAGSNNKIPHEIHLARHEGYEIVRPTDFFQQYGPYVLLILKMLKFSVSVASVAVPAVAHLLNADALDHAAKGLQHLKDCIEPGMDQVISKIEKDSLDEGEPVENFADRMENKEALEGADLRKLETFLKDKDENKVLGNLYRTVTDEGHVKWVCMDHYRENYNKTAAEAFRRVVDAVGGSFDENNGLAKVKLRSRVMANQFYLVLEKARSVYELDIILDWACTTTDIQALEDALNKSIVSALHVDLQQFQPRLTNKLSSIPTRYEVFGRILNPLNMRSIHIVLPRNISKLSNFNPKRPPHLRKLSFEMAIGSNIRIHAEMLEAGSTITTLYLQKNNIGSNGAQALPEALKTNSTLTTLNLYDSSIGSNGAQALFEALKTNSTLTTLYLGFNSIGDNGAQALSEALKTNSTLTTLNLEINSIGSNGAQALSEALKTNSTLTTLNLYYNSIGDKGAQALSEALKTNSALTTLNLESNSIGDKGAQALSEALETNSTLTTLNLKSNSIGDKGAQGLSEALKTNSTLTTLNLYNNPIEGKEAQALFEALKTNSALNISEI